tara:strand:+ start:1973 stop:2719 length:747 start_codon:yes stop_codon:yes gene_type:complete
MKILGISGRKQAGKNTVANILHGLTLHQNGLIKDYNIGKDGQLMILTEDSLGREGWGEFDVSRKDQDFVDYAERNMWPYVKLYSFADYLKWICVNLFDIPHDCVWGTEEQKNQLQAHLLWENMPCLEVFNNPQKKGPMTAREFMQFFGTDVCRKIYEPVWVSSCIKKIQEEQCNLAIIADVRFPNEAKAIEDAGGKVIRLTRKVFNDSHSSEIALDDYPFTDFIDNSDESIDSLMVKVKRFFQHLKEN